MNNLNQMGKALESYSGDYSEYYPCMPAYGTQDIVGYDGDYASLTYMTGWKDDGYYMDARLKGQFSDTNRYRVRTNGYGNMKSTGYYDYYGVVGTPFTRQRCIFQGDKADSCEWSDATANRLPPKEGELNFAPIGLGYLIVGDYLGDVRSMYCPSTGGTMMVPAHHWSYNSYNEPYGNPFKVDGVTSLARFREAGGFDAKSILYGDWSNLAAYSAYYDKSRAIFADYQYRGNPIVIPAYSGPVRPYGHTYYDGPERAWTRLNDITVYATKPAIHTGIACPVFKTPKQAGGRAIVADSFGRSHDGQGPGWWPAPEINGQPPGNGSKAHKDGYNVLYADWHVKWYGDPQQRFIWWREYNSSTDDLPHATNHYVLWNIMANTGATGLNWFKNADGSDWDFWYTPDGWISKLGSGYAWHILDVAADFDVDADESDQN